MVNTESPTRTTFTFAEKPTLVYPIIAVIIFSVTDFFGVREGQRVLVVTVAFAFGETVLIVVLFKRNGIVVDDNGPGFPSIDGALALGGTTKSDGLGVGLPLVQRMLSLMNGALHLANRSTTGASVTLTLPRA